MDYYERSLDALDLLAREVRDGRAAPFGGLTTEESNSALRAMRVELDREVSSTLIACSTSAAKR